MAETSQRHVADTSPGSDVRGEGHSGRGSSHLGRLPSSCAQDAAGGTCDIMEGNTANSENH